jgi:hypothetical protein
MEGQRFKRRRCLLLDNGEDADDVRRPMTRKLGFYKLISNMSFLLGSKSAHSFGCDRTKFCSDSIETIQPQNCKLSSTRLTCINTQGPMFRSTNTTGIQQYINLGQTKHWLYLIEHENGFSTSFPNVTSCTDRKASETERRPESFSRLTI